MLAAAYWASGELTAARSLEEETLATHRRIRGYDHPDTLSSANNLAATLRALGEHTAADALEAEFAAARARRAATP